MNQTPDISIITVNYNGIKETSMLVESLLRHGSFDYELIIIDNGSVQDEARLLQQRYPSTICVRSERNLGFSGGNNLGIKEAKGKYLLLLNNDTYITDSSLRFLCEAIEQKPEIGAVGPKIRFAQSPQPIQFAGYTALSSMTLRNRLIGFNEPDHGQCDTPMSTPYLHGAAMMVKREVIEKVGLMPEIYFLYYEELDWCTQMTKAGYELWYEPRCTVFHQESRSTGVDSPLKAFYLTRNRLLYAYRNRKASQLLFCLLYQWSIAIPKGILVYLIEGKIKQSLAVMKGCIAFLTLKNKKK